MLKLFKELTHQLPQRRFASLHPFVTAFDTRQMPFFLEMTAKFVNGRNLIPAQIIRLVCSRLGFAVEVDVENIISHDGAVVVESLSVKRTGCLAAPRRFATTRCQ